MEAVKVHEIKREGNPELAQEVREIADRIESGHISDFAMVADDVDLQEYRSTAMFRDRWRMIGALDFIKTKMAE